MSVAEALTYTLRPDSTALWLPRWIAEKLGLWWGDKLSTEQFDSAEVQDLLAMRLVAQKERRR